MKLFLETILSLIMVFILAGLFLGAVLFLTRVVVPFIFGLV